MANIQMNAEVLVANYDYPAYIEIVKKTDDAIYPDNERVCESCNTILSRKGEIWLRGQVDTCPRCLPSHLGNLQVAEITAERKTTYSILVTNDNWVGGYCVGDYATEREADFARLLLEHCKTL